MTASTPEHGTSSVEPNSEVPKEATSCQPRRTNAVDTIIIDKSALFRAGLIHTLEKTRFRVVSEYSSVAAFSERAASEDAVVLIGLDRTSHDGIAGLTSLREDGRLGHLIILGEDLEEKEFDLVIGLRCDSYMLKHEITPEILLRSMELVMLGEEVFSRDFMQMLRQHWSGAAVAASGDCDIAGSNGRMRGDVLQIRPAVEPAQIEGRLSARETAILLRLMQGESNKHIARELDIAETTVKVHVKSVLRKIRVRNRTQAATWAWARSSQLGLATEQPREVA